MKRSILLLCLMTGLAAAGYAELREIGGIDCELLVDRCVRRGTKFYIDWTPADQAAADKHDSEYTESTARTAALIARGMKPTLMNCQLWDDANGAPYPGADAFLRKYNMDGYCRSSNGDPDCYLDKHCGQMHAKFANIQDPVRRLDVGMADYRAFEAYLNTQPKYSCAAVNGKCASCRLTINGQSRNVTCEEGFSKQAETMALLRSYPTWKNPTGVAGVSAGSPSGGSGRQSISGASPGITSFGVNFGGSSVQLSTENASATSPD